MDFKEFWKSLDDENRQNFADQCGLSCYYITNQLVYGYKTPRLKNIEKMAEASDGKFTFDDLCNFFKDRIKEA